MIGTPRIGTPRRIRSAQRRDHHRFRIDIVETFEERVVPSTLLTFDSDPSTPYNQTSTPSEVPTVVPSTSPANRIAADGVDRIYVKSGSVIPGNNSFRMTFVTSVDVPVIVSFAIYKVQPPEDGYSQNYLFNQTLMDVRTVTINPPCTGNSTSSVTVCVPNVLDCNYQVDAFVSGYVLSSCQTLSSGQEVVTQFNSSGTPQNPSYVEYPNAIIGSIISVGCDDNGVSKDVCDYRNGCAWPAGVTQLAIGDEVYSKASLVVYLNLPDCLSPLVRATQDLIAAKLNKIADSGYSSYAANQAVDRAISGLDRFYQVQNFDLFDFCDYIRIGSSSSSASPLNGWDGTLDAFNKKD
ncbi:MAG: hypothetical protein U0800_22345 [Isosphaeraceae bacterium]